MKDICGNEIQAGHMVHLWWPDNDYLCTVVRTRGRGIKFVSDDGKEFTKEFLEENNVQIAIQGGQQISVDQSVSVESPITTDELLMIGKLRDAGWYGVLLKKTMGLSTFKIEMPELQ